MSGRRNHACPGRGGPVQKLRCMLRSTALHFTLLSLLPTCVFHTTSVLQTHKAATEGYPYACQNTCSDLLVSRRPVESTPRQQHVQKGYFGPETRSRMPTTRTNQDDCQEYASMYHFVRASMTGLMHWLRHVMTLAKKTSVNHQHGIRS